MYYGRYIDISNARTRPVNRGHFSATEMSRRTFPPGEYRSAVAGVGAPIYETARLLPRGDDGGLAEAFLRGARRSRHTGDT
jgi:hypothetical protein